MNDLAYRGPGKLGEKFEAPPAPPPRHKGPRKNCPACGAGSGEYSVQNAKFCVHGKRLTWFQRCPYRGVHLHQTCKKCGAEWICDPVEDWEYAEVTAI